MDQTLRCGWPGKSCMLKSGKSTEIFPLKLSIKDARHWHKKVMSQGTRRNHLASSRKLKTQNWGLLQQISSLKLYIFPLQCCKKSLPPPTLRPRGEKSNLCIFCETAMPQRISFPTVHLSLFHWRLLFLSPPPRAPRPPSALRSFFRLPDRR